MKETISSRRRTTMPTDKKLSDAQRQSSMRRLIQGGVISATSLDFDGSVAAGKAEESEKKKTRSKRSESKKPKDK